MTRVARRTRSYFVIAGAATLLGLGATAGWEVARAQHVHSHAPAAEKGWLVRLAPDARTPAIERQLRGFETTMAEVAYRYTEMYWGGVDGNWGYAEHMAHEMGNAMTLGLERRPPNISVWMGRCYSEQRHLFVRPLVRSIIDFRDGRKYRLFVLTMMTGRTHNAGRRDA